MKIEAGKFYRTREGLKVGPMESWCGYFSAKLGGPDLLWWPDGERGSAVADNIPEQDLIAEWTDESAQPTTGTLAELNVMPGDVVVTVDNPEIEYIGINCTINSDGIAESDCGFKFWPSYDDSYGRTYRIISRASQSTTPLSHSTTPSSPVRTVTRKEIVPGVYGIVDLAGCDKYMVQIRLQSNAPLKTWFDASQLTAAIETLIEIRDALEKP